MAAKTFEEIVRKKVEGQINSFLNDHPEVLETGVTSWKKPPGKSPKDMLKDSLAKRVVRDLLCPETLASLKLSLQVWSGDAAEVEVPFASADQ